MRLLLVGSDHTLEAPSRLARLCVERERVQARLLELRQCGAVRGAVLLATCNRFEVLVECDGDGGNGGNGAPAEPSAEELFGCDPGIRLRRCADGDAVEHLLGVAAGLHSMVFGEEQILGQLRDAFRSAEEHCLLGRRLHMLRSRLLGAAREVRQRTGLCHRPPSVAGLAVEQLVAAGPRIAVVGAGATGRLLLEILQRRHAQDVLVVNRTVGRAEALARHFGGRAMSLQEFRAARPPLDAVVFALRSDRPLLTRAEAAGLRVVVDVSQPSVLAGDVREGPGPRVVSLDELAAIARPLHEEYAALKDLALAEVATLARRIGAEVAGGRPNLGRVVDLHVEGALALLDQVLGGELSHLGDADREVLRAVVVRAARRNAHFHIQDLRQLATAR